MCLLAMALQTYLPVLQLSLDRVMARTYSSKSVHEHARRVHVEPIQKCIYQWQVRRIHLLGADIAALLDADVIAFQTGTIYCAFRGSPEVDSQLVGVSNAGPGAGRIFVLLGIVDNLWTQFRSFQVASVRMLSSF